MNDKEGQRSVLRFFIESTTLEIGADPKQIDSLINLILKLDLSETIISSLSSQRRLGNFKLNDSSLVNAIKSNNTELVRLILDEGVDPNEDLGDESLLALAIEIVNPKMVQMLLNAGANPRKINSQKRNICIKSLIHILTFCLRSEYVEILKILYRHGLKERLKIVIDGLDYDERKEIIEYSKIGTKGVRLLN